MPNPPLSDELCAEAIQAVKLYGTVTAAARALGINRATMQGRVNEARDRQGRFSSDDPNDRIRALEAQLKLAKAAQVDEEYVIRKIIKLTEADASPPAWLTKPPKAGKNVGVPTLFASDWHWGEVVDPTQINGVNQFDLEIAQRRARNLVTVAVELLNQYLTAPSYPGIVFALGGDMVSGDIHEELTATNEREIMPTVIDLYGVLVWCISTLADSFGNVFVPAVTGNHGRNTNKIRAKGRAFTSFDWLIYQFLAKHFERDKRVRFYIPNGVDASFRIYGHRYVLSHGDAFRGGDGMVGALGPIIRGDHKKRSRNAQIDLEYDTLLIGHWHQLIQMQRIIVNGSLKGYDEYAYGASFPFEPPRQALWITHPQFGITFSAPVLVDRPAEESKPASWVSWAA